MRSSKTLLLIVLFGGIAAFLAYQPFQHESVGGIVEAADQSEVDSDVPNVIRVQAALGRDHAGEAGEVKSSKEDYASSLLQILESDLSQKDRDVRILVVLAKWGEVDPRSALAFVLSNFQGSAIETAMYVDSVLEGWLISYPHEAWAWAVNSVVGLETRSDAESRHIRTERMRILTSTLLNRGDFHLLGELLKSTPESISMGLTNNVAQVWAGHDSAGAISWMHSLDRGTGPQANAILGVFKGLGAKSPEVAQDLYNTLMRSENLRDRASATMGYSLVFTQSSDREGAFYWLQSATPDGQDGEFDFAIANYFSRSLLRSAPLDGSAERELMARISTPSLRYGAARGYVAAIKSEAPVDAIHTIARFYPENVKQRAIQEVADGALDVHRESVLQAIRIIDAQRQ